MHSINEKIAAFRDEWLRLAERRSALSAIYTAIPLAESLWDQFTAAIREIADSDWIESRGYSSLFAFAMQAVKRQFEASTCNSKPAGFFAEMILHRARVASGTAINIAACIPSPHSQIIEALTQVCRRNDATITHGFVTIRGVAFRTLAKLSPSSAAPFWNTELRLDAITILRKWIVDTSSDSPYREELREELAAIERPSLLKSN